MCGVVGIFGHDYVAQDIYDGMVTLQHRGQDAAGMITYDGTFHTHKDLGLVKDVFRTRHMRMLTGYAGIGHTRYSTIGGSADETQPFFFSAPFGVALAHNGNLFNSHELKEELFRVDHRHVNSNNDAEVLLNLFTKALTRQNKDKLKLDHIAKAVSSVFKRSKGAYSVVSYIAKQGMVAFRDPHGIRPLVFGKRKKGLNMEYIFASESVTLDVLGFEFVRDVRPGEVIFIDEKTRKVYSKVLTDKKHTPCIFEYIYFARPDSVLNDVSVYKSRLRMGQKLAAKVKKMKLDIDVVMPVPDSSRTAALAVAETLGIKYREGLVKNRYIGRTFIMPGQNIRKKSIKYKLNPMPMEIKDKKVLLVDDSVVRGNTSRQIVKMMRDAGAKKVYFTSYSPPVKSPCLYGIDIPTKDELIAGNNTVEEIRKYLGADELIYGDLKDIFEACIAGTPKLKDMCMGCFDGVYKTRDIDAKVLKQAAEARKAERNSCEGLDDGEPSSGQLNLV
ncbi:MAG: amidophosphoribosyltransferase [Candidatus Peregrinibacteria bacterium]